MNRLGSGIVGLCLLITAAGCGGIASVDGGPVGTGISASVSGNVAAVAQGSAADSAAMGSPMMPAVRVTIDEVPGIGPRKRRALLTTFGSVAGVRRATREELDAVVGPKAAAAVIDYFAKSA